MLQAQANLLCLLDKALFGYKDQNSIYFNSDEWAAIMNEAKQQAVYSIIFDYVKDLLYEQVTSEEFTEYERLHLGLDANAVRNRLYHNDLHVMLTERNIRYVILKGMASAMYYPDPGLRSMGDVDFLVDHENVKLVDQFLSERGYRKKKESEGHDFHWSYRKNDECRELHWEPPGIPRSDNAAIKAYFGDMLDQARLIEMEGVTFYAPSVFHHGLVLLLHTVNHMTSTGVGLRHLNDWILFENTISEEEFVKIFQKPLKEIGLWRFAQIMTRTGILYLGCAERSWCNEIDGKICSQFIEDILNGGNFGRKDSVRSLQSFLVRNNDSKRITDPKSLIPNVFANINKVVKQKYRIMKKHKILLPAGWLFVGSRYLVRVAMGKRKFFLSKDSLDNVKVRTDIYSELKLFEKE